MAKIKKKAADKRRHSVNVRFSDNEYKALITHLKANGIKLKSKWIRAAAMSLIAQESCVVKK